MSLKSASNSHFPRDQSPTSSTPKGTFRSEITARKTTVNKLLCRNEKPRGENLFWKRERLEKIRRSCSQQNETKLSKETKRDTGGGGSLTQRNKLPASGRKGAWARSPKGNPEGGALGVCGLRMS